MGHPNPPNSFTFCYIVRAEELIWKCKSAEICCDRISAVDKTCCLPKSCHQPAPGPTGRVIQRNKQVTVAKPHFQPWPCGRDG